MIGALAEIAAGIVLFTILILIVIPLSTLFGAITGWVVGWFFGETILHVLKQIGVHDLSMWQLGTTLGFVGGFFKASCGGRRK